MDTRATSRGELAVIMMGVDCAERIMLHESVGFDLPEGAFVFKTGGSHAGIIDQLLAQGALKIDKVFDMVRRCRLKPIDTSICGTEHHLLACVLLIAPGYSA